jgi:hypothetical protein
MTSPLEVEPPHSVFTWPDTRVPVHSRIGHQDEDPAARLAHLHAEVLLR